MKGLFFSLFAISGFSGLIYESIWSHYLKLFLGHAAYAQTLVLAIFMGGMALGSWLCSRYSSRWKNLLLGYALAEGLVGLFALLFHPVFDHLTQTAYTSIMPAIGDPALVTIFKWSLATLLIFPQSILLGMTFPLMSAGVIRLFPETPGQTVAMLYFTNSIGAAIGVLISGFVFIAWVGLPGTIRIAGFINILLALTVWLLAKDRAQSQPVSQQADVTPKTHSKEQWYFALLVVSALTGTASFIYEVSWIRMLSLVLGSSTHAFELMLSAFIFGLAFGGLWIRLRIRRIKNVVLFLAMVQLVMGILALSTLPLYGNTFEVMQWLLGVLEKNDTGYTLFTLSSHGIALAIMLPTTLCAGMTLPLITHSLIRLGNGEKSIGAVYAANTIGAIIGVFFAIHLGLPSFGLKGALWSGAAIDIALALFLLLYLQPHLQPQHLQSKRNQPKDFQPEKNANPIFIGAVTGVGALCIVLLFVHLDPYKMSSGVYRTGKLLSATDTELLFHKDGKTATVDLHREIDAYVNIRTNGKVDATINMTGRGELSADEPTMVLAAAVPYAFHPEAKNAAVIGMGSGLTTHTLLTIPTLATVDTVEIEPAIVEAAQGFRPRVELAYTDPRSHIHIDDAKTYFSSHGKQYDIIISEPSNPWVSGVASLFTEEFYQLLNRHISDKGVLVQWLQVYELNMELIASVIKALAPYFDDYAIYYSTDRDILIVAKKKGGLSSPSAAIFSVLGLKDELAGIHINTLKDLDLRRLAEKSAIHPLFASFDISANSDYYPVLDLKAVKQRFLNHDAADLIALSYANIPALKLLDQHRLTDNYTSITPYHTPVITIYTMLGTFIRDTYLNTGRHDGFFPPKYSKNLQDMNQYFFQCAPASTSQKIDVLLTFANATTPFLSKQELDSIWQVVTQSGCYARLTDIDKDWIKLLRSLSTGDADSMSRVSRHLLNNPTLPNPSHDEFLLGSALLADLLLNQSQEAAQIWQRYHS
ncbi:MAG: fused MFS/spermidine synthase, partial [Gammaproteobacteria bacterium]